MLFCDPNKFKADDSLDVFGVHGCGDMWGVLANGLFGSVGVAAAISLINPRLNLRLTQVLAIIATIAFTAVGTLLVATDTRWAFGPLRVPLRTRKSDSMKPITEKTDIVLEKART